MADNATISVLDGNATPVTHSFDPTGIRDGNVATYQNKAAASFAARETLQLKMKQSAKVRTVTRELRVPRSVTETVNGVSVVKVVDYATLRSESIVPLDWGEDQITAARVLAANIDKSTVVADMVDNGEFVW